MHIEEAKNRTGAFLAILPDEDGGFRPCPDLMTEAEVIQFLRIPEISNSKDHRNVIANLKRMRDLPRIHLCGKTLYPLGPVKAWIERNVTCGQ